MKDELQWPQPDALLAQLGELSSSEASGRWAKDVVRLLQKLGPEMSRQPEVAAATLRQLEELAAKAMLLETALKDQAVIQGLSRAEHALSRRIDIWQHVQQIEAAGLPESPLPVIDAQALPACLAAIDAMLAGKPERNAWQQFLAVDQLRAWIARRSLPQVRLPQELAMKVLMRLDHPEMSAEQREFVAGGPIGALRQELRRHAALTIRPGQLLRHLERYEQSGLPSDARLLAEDCQYLALSSDEAYRRLGNAVECHYRNANLRLAISAALLNRLIPSREPEYADVNDSVMGLPVRGRSMTSTRLGVRLLPDPTRVMLALEITGQVSALTSSSSGPATFINDSNSMYAALRPLEVDLHGIRLGETQVAVYNQTRLRDVQTDFDGIPLFGALVNNVARSQHEQKEPELTREVKEKVSARRVSGSTRRAMKN